MRLAEEALGQGETETRSIPAANLEVAVLDRTRTQQRKFKRLRAGQLTRILGDGGPAEPPGGGVDGPGGGPGASTDPSGPDDPADPTDTAGDVAPLEDPVTGEPNDRDEEPPVAPPLP
jgi:proteasome alpha subunit